MKWTNNAYLQAIVGLAATILCTAALATDLRDTDGDVTLILEGSPYRLLERLTFLAEHAGDCVIERETLSIEDGLEPGLNGYWISIWGGNLNVGEATITGPAGSRESDVRLSDRTRITS